jgi:hypothetical protein
MDELNVNAKLWVEALESGKYKQGQRRLTTVRDGEQFDCCLGVACKLYESVVGGLQPKVNEDTWVTYVEYDGHECTVLPEKVMNWLGLSECSGRYKDGEAYFQLSEKNDNGMSFSEIAAIIRAQPKELFAAQ